MLTPKGPSPVAKGTWGAKMDVVAPVAVLSRMEAVSSKMLAVAKSGFPSPLKSSVLMKRGPLPVVKVTWVAKPSKPL